ncbi:glycosyltransferase family 2 protein [Bifidobacterium longum]|uniref:glycosyltransferase family 2 protein n=1 Tax=Bifidobacterium longum TaxID=216816 RepID=UPI0030D443F7
MGFSISAVIPVFNADAVTLSKCLSSICSQREADFEVEGIVIFDGCPSSAVLDTVKRFRDFRFVEIEHGGVSAARNEGIEQAIGKYLTFVDADDELPQHALKDLFTYAERHSCDVVQGAYDAVLPSSVEHHSYREVDEIFKDENLGVFQQDVLCPDKGVSLVWGKLFRRSFIVENGIHFDREMEVSEDTAFVLDVCSRARIIGFTPSVVYRYIRNDSSAVSSYRSDYEDRILKSIERMQDHVKHIPNSNLYQESFDSYVLFHLLLVQMHYLFNQSAPWSGKQRREQYEKTLRRTVFQDALKSSDYKGFSFAKRVSLHMLKFHLYQCSRFISFVRHVQLSK